MSAKFVVWATFFNTILISSASCNIFTDANSADNLQSVNLKSVVFKSVNFKNIDTPLAYSSDNPANNFELLILHNNDMHSRFEEISRKGRKCEGEDCVGGFARTYHVIKEARAAAANKSGPNVLYLNAGDTCMDTVWYYIHRQDIVVEFLNALKPDLMCLGNHEFDDGTTGLLKILNGTQFPIIATNLNFSKNPELNAKHIPKSIILTINGRKIGFMSYLTTAKAMIKHTEKVEFLDEVRSLQEECKILEQQGANIIIALGHSGFTVDQKIAKEVDCVDIVVGGHTHTFLWNGPQPDLEKPAGPYPFNIQQSTGKIVPIVQASAFTKYLGKLHATFDEDGNLIKSYGQPIFMNRSIPQDPNILKLLDKYRPKVDDTYKQIVGHTKAFLQNENCLYEECNLGNFIADCFASYRMFTYQGKGWSDVPIAVVQGAAVKKSFNETVNQGAISLGDLVWLMPFENNLQIMELKGSVLIESLEVAIENLGKKHSGFAQISGMRYKINLNNPPGSKVTNMEVKCTDCSVPVFEPLDMNKMYRVIGNADLPMKNISTWNNYVVSVENITDIEVLRQCFERHEVIAPAIEGRIVFSGCCSFGPYITLFMFFVTFFVCNY